uniref:protein-serine/threonine phosphatase n=1 Tax=Zea mays TaxID=4577 RepID=B4FVM3_MAIZE|nr:unknown [Zea mays]
MREEGPWGPPPPAPPPPSVRLSLSLVVLLLLLLLPGRAASFSTSCWCQGREGVAEVARMGLAGDGSADTAHLSNNENGRFIYGVASSPGKRASMEDFYEARIDDVDGEKIGMFGVYDGHGGVRAAEYVKQHLFSNLIKHPKFITDTKAAIAETYNLTDSEFLKADSCQTRDAGSTASTAIIVGDRLLVANVGDSRAVISKGGQGKFLVGNMTYLNVFSYTSTCIGNFQIIICCVFSWTSISL